MGKLFFVSLLICSFSFPVFAQADKGGEKIKLNAEFSMADTLKTFKGSKTRVSLLLRNGISYNGIVLEVGPNFAVISQLSGKDFFDALVRLDDVSGLEVKAR